MLFYLHDLKMQDSINQMLSYALRLRGSVTSDALLCRVLIENIDYIYLEQMVHRIYPAELQLNKADASDTEVAFFRLKLIDSL